MIARIDTAGRSRGLAGLALEGAVCFKTRKRWQDKSREAWWGVGGDKPRKNNVLARCVRRVCSLSAWAGRYRTVSRRTSRDRP